MKYLYSTNDEVFWPSVTEALEADFYDERHEGERVQIFLAEAMDYYPAKQCLARHLMDTITDNAFDDLGEDNIQDWCGDVMYHDMSDLQVEIEYVVTRWLKKHSLETMFTVPKRPVGDMVIEITADGGYEVLEENLKA